MAGNSHTSGAVHSAILSNPYLLGPLSRLVDAKPDAVAAIAPIKAIWRNELGPAVVSNGQAET